MAHGVSHALLRLDAAPAGARVLAHGADEVRAHQLDRARAAGRDEAAALLERAVARLDEGAAEARAELARAAAELGVEIARALLRSAQRRQDYDVEALVRETLAAAAVGRGPCVVHLNPADHARLADVRFRSGTRIEPDEGVARGDVHVETALGVLVRDLDGALESIAKRLREELA